MQRPWLVPVYTMLGIPLGLYIGHIGGVDVMSAEVVVISVVAVAGLNIWFFAFLRPKFWRQQKGTDERAAGEPATGEP